MRDLIADIKYDVSKVISQAIGPSKEFCMGYMNPGASNGEGYISTMKLSVGTVEVKNLDNVTEAIVTYDRCEKHDAYIGQINMLSTSSSFCGQNGAIWGYDLAIHEDIASKKEKPIYKQPQPGGGPDIPVYNIRPLIDATERLFGKEKQRRFPPMPGAHVICASKGITARGPLWVWSAIGVAILKNRSDGACLFIQDANVHGNDSTNESDIIGYLEGTLRSMTNSIALCAQDQEVEYERIYVGYKYIFVEPHEIGSALACIPSVYLAQNAVPKGMKAADLCKTTLIEWEQKLKLEELTIVE